MNKIFLLLALGLTASLTAFSQSSGVIIPDKKVDSFYCFGIQKTKALVAQSVSLEAKEKQLGSCEAEILDRKAANAAKDSSLAAKNEELAAWIFKEAKWKEEKQSFGKTIDLQSGELKKEKKKGLATGLGFGGGLLLNAVLTAAILIKK